MDEYESSEIILQDLHAENTSWECTEDIEYTLKLLRVHLLLGFLIDEFLQDCQTIPTISTENLFLFIRVLRMSLVSYP